MRVLHLDSGRQMRGGQWQVLYLLLEQQRAGHQALLLARKSGALYSTAREEGLQTAALSLAALHRVSRACDIAHCHDARSHGFAALASRCPFVVSRRVAFPVRPGFLSRWKYSRAAHYLAVSRAAAAELTAAGVRPERVSIVPDAVLIPGEPSSRTGPVVAVDLDDPGKGKLLIQQASARAGFEVHFARDLPEALSTARLFVYISAREGLGSAALLAMAFGVPVIASRVGGLPEVVLDGVTGLLVDNDPAAIAAAVERLLADPALAARLGDQGRERARSLHSFPTIAAATASVYRQVVS